MLSKFMIMKRLGFISTLNVFGTALFILLSMSCEKVDNDPDKHISDADPSFIELQEVAEILTLLPIESNQLVEVHDAVSSSSCNGYDEEYLMSNLFSQPGSGVGDPQTRSGKGYGNPMRSLIEAAVKDISAGVMKSGAKADLNVSSTIERLGPDRFIDALKRSDIQIYWPFSDEWDGEGGLIVTYDPEDGSDINIGYRLFVGDDGFRQVEEVLVDEEMAKECPVWVVNRNDDATFTSLEMLRREDPDWGEGGGNIIVKPKSAKVDTKASGTSRSLILRDFTMKRNYDTWFAGASEFFVKLGAVEDFSASTEAELRLYNPSITDFMVVVRRNKLGVPQPFNAVLVSDMSEQLTHCAMMITEDDGGTITKWETTALVRIASKSYGIELSFPFNSRDDIVWRGQLATTWFENNSNVVGHFGDVDLTFEVLEN